MLKTHMEKTKKNNCNRFIIQSYYSEETNMIYDPIFLEIQKYIKNNEGCKQSTHKELRAQRPCKWACGNVWQRAVEVYKCLPTIYIRVSKTGDGQLASCDTIFFVYANKGRLLSPL